MHRANRGGNRPQFAATSRNAVIVLLIASAAFAQPVAIPAGGYWMGRSEPEPPGCSPSGTCYYDDEMPIHWVELPTFQISPYEVTNSEYAAFLNAVGTIADAKGNPYIDASDPQIRIRWNGSSWGADPGWENHPMREVSWYGADAYCRWAGGRLPTEAEWEKAAGWDEAAQHARRWPWSDTWGCGYCSSWWCNAPYNGGPSTLPVGSFPSGVSPYGLFDMAGNVWEWTMGGYVSYPGGPLTFADYSREVRRGGSWTNSDYNERCAVRSPQPRYITEDNLGFRVCYSDMEPWQPPTVILPRTTYSEWVEDFNVSTPMDQIYNWWGTGRSFTIDAANGWLLASLQGSTYPSGEYMAMIRRDTGTLFAAGDYVDITVRLRYERGDRDFARTSVGVAWGDTRTIVPGGRGADENFGYPWFLVANNSDLPNVWQEVTLKQVRWAEGKFCLGFGLWGNLSDKATPPIVNRHRMWVDWVRVRHSEPVTSFADFDYDGDVDADDVIAFESCATGPGIQAATNCTHCDFDHDQDVDHVDFAFVQRCISGSGIPADPLCIPAAPSPAGQADFIADVTSGPAPQTVQFTDLSTVPDAWAWYWEFGDGQTGTLRNPVHVYDTPGTYTVRLTTTGSGGPVVAEKQSYIRISNEKRVAFLIAAPANTADNDIVSRLQSMNLLVNVYDDDAGNRPTAAEIASSHDLVIVSSTVLAANVDAEFRHQAVPVIYWESSLSINGREALADGANIYTGTQISITDNTHPIMAGLPLGPATVTGSSASISYNSGVVAAGVRVLATAVGNSAYKTVMVAEPGAALLDGGVAAQKRVFLFLYDNTYTSLNAAGKQIFDNAVSYALGW